MGQYPETNMKASLIAITLAICALLFISGADSESAKVSAQQTSSFCSGYAVIEAGKGLDCNGDTILLVTRKGYYERIYVEEPSIADGLVAN